MLQIVAHATTSSHVRKIRLANRAIGQKVCVKTDITVDISIVMSV